MTPLLAVHSTDLEELDAIEEAEDVSETVDLGDINNGFGESAVVAAAEARLSGVEDDDEGVDLDGEGIYDDDAEQGAEEGDEGIYDEDADADGIYDEDADADADDAEPADAGIEEHQDHDLDEGLEETHANEAGEAETLEDLGVLDDADGGEDDAEPASLPQEAPAEGKANVTEVEVEEEED
eukprot:CAMPEP_0178454748 /NCGR_PEP_ID=MMETSP0689_2-20121128/45538_1 /TAXON_ID=160604 /ORGANISM="Amphidinium massartii, Strain CS-259" /LENGTH=181 /DNA_ID=CAMNT_0020080731 /DNA_START=210 /DNA_END=752 /DNA_ORIENTATION=-